MPFLIVILLVLILLGGAIAVMVWWRLRTRTVTTPPIVENDTAALPAMQMNVLDSKHLVREKAVQFFKRCDVPLPVLAIPRTVRFTQMPELAILAGIELSSRRVGHSVVMVKPRPDGEYDFLPESGPIITDFALLSDQGCHYVGFDPGPPLDSCGIKMWQWEQQGWRNELIDGSRAMVRRNGFSIDRFDDVIWISWVENHDLLWAGRKANGRWDTFAVSKRSGSGDQVGIVALSAERAALVSLRSDGTGHMGNTVIGAYQTHSMKTGLKEDLRSAMTESSSRDVLITMVEANGTSVESILTTVDNAQIPALSKDKYGRLVCATLHADDPPDFTRFRITLATQADEAWVSEVVGIFENDAPFHIKILRDATGQWFEGEVFIVAFKARLDASPVQLQPVVVWKDATQWRTEELPAVDFDDEQCAHYHPVSDAALIGGKLHIAVPSMRRNKQGCIQWFTMEKPA